MRRDGASVVPASVARRSRARRVRLPTGVALYQVNLEDRQLIFIAAHVSGTRARLARDAAARIAERGRPVVVITDQDLDRAMS